MAEQLMQTTPGLVASKGTLRIEGMRSKSVGLQSSAVSTRNVGGTGERSRVSPEDQSGVLPDYYLTISPQQQQEIIYLV